MATTTTTTTTTTTSWIVDSTGDQLHTDDEQPIGRVRERMRQDAARWRKRGLTFEGVVVDRDSSVSQESAAYIITGEGYRLRMQQRDGYWPADALARAAVDDWSEAPASSEPRMTRDEWIKRFADRMCARGSWMTHANAVGIAEHDADTTEQAGSTDPEEWESPEAVADELLEGEGVMTQDPLKVLTPFSTDEQKWYVANGYGQVLSGPFDDVGEADAWITRKNTEV